MKAKCLVISILILILMGIIPVRLAIAYFQAPHPQAILTLGGSADREEFAAQLAQSDPNLEVWVSTGIPIHKSEQIFNGAGISSKRVHLDRRAVDTVTNFTTLVEDFKNRHIQHIYLVTSDFHIPRARAIAFVVLGSQGIAFTTLSLPSKLPKESKFRVLRDSSRALLWVITKRTGASLNPHLPKPNTLQSKNIAPPLCRSRR